MACGMWSPGVSELMVSALKELQSEERERRVYCRVISNTIEVCPESPQSVRSVGYQVRLSMKKFKAVSVLEGLRIQAGVQSLSAEKEVKETGMRAS